MYSSHARGCESDPINLYTQGYLSFWNDNISYALRGCILIELALRRRIIVHKDPNRRRIPAAERLVEVVDTRQTGETILDETLKMMKAQESERMSINSWIDLLSGARGSPSTEINSTPGSLLRLIVQARLGTCSR